MMAQYALGDNQASFCHLIYGGLRATSRTENVVLLDITITSSSHVAATKRREKVRKLQKELESICRCDKENENKGEYVHKWL